MRPINALRRAWARIWSPRSRWTEAPIDDSHRIYREQYDGVLPSLPGLPRGDANETRNAYMFLAEIGIGLHNYGEHPMLEVPKASPAALGPQRLVDFGEVGQVGQVGPRQGLMGSLGAMAGARTWLLGGAALLAVTGSGWAMNAVTGARLHHAKDALEQARDTAEHNAQAAIILAAQRDAFARGLDQAQAQSLASAQTIETERARAARARHREQEREREIRNALAGGDPPAWRLRDPEPAAPGGSDEHPGAAESNPGGMPH